MEINYSNSQRDGYYSPFSQSENDSYLEANYKLITIKQINFSILKIQKIEIRTIKNLILLKKIKKLISSIFILKKINLF